MHLKHLMVVFNSASSSDEANDRKVKNTGKGKKSKRATSTKSGKQQRFYCFIIVVYLLCVL